MTAIRDLPGDYAGPLAGVAAAVAALADDPAQWLLSLAVDTPFYPMDFLVRARPFGITADVVLGCFGAQDYPTNALWRLDAIRDLPNAVRTGNAPRSLKRLASELRSARLDYAGFVADDPFANVNTPEDLANLTRRGTRGTAG
jgi:molybdopterin-guanine dinucleotide biosynthesis protein A